MKNSLIRFVPRNGSNFRDSVPHIRQLTSFWSIPPKMDVTTLAVPFLQKVQNYIFNIHLFRTQCENHIWHLCGTRWTVDDEFHNIHAALSVSSWESDPILGGGCVRSPIATILELPVEVVQQVTHELMGVLLLITSSRKKYIYLYISM